MRNSVALSIQNSPMAITLAILITGVAGGVPDLALPAAVYSITMYAVALPTVLLLRGWGSPSELSTSPSYKLDS